MADRLVLVRGSFTPWGDKEGLCYDFIPEHGPHLEGIPWLGDNLNVLPLDPADPRYEAFKNDLALRLCQVHYQRFTSDAYTFASTERFWHNTSEEFKNYWQFHADAVLALLRTWPDDKEPDNDR